MSTPLNKSIREGSSSSLDVGDSQDNRLKRLLQTLRSDSDISATKGLTGEDAQMFLDSTQELLEKKGIFPRPQEDALFHKACRLVETVSRSSDRLPASLFVTRAASKAMGAAFKGANSYIFICDRHNGLDYAGPVILKHLRIIGKDQRENRKNLCREALVWRRLHHTSVLEFLGVDDKTISYPHVFLISPFLKNGTIMKYRQEKGPHNVPIRVHAIFVTSLLRLMLRNFVTLM
ncbi:hypothetical protein B0H19DRAFT_1141611 [Mycena capillaripes]|nr:hypothetical protein B0H19DRAFT_1141611 [Mycena capillaripes]